MLQKRFVAPPQELIEERLENANNRILRLTCMHTKIKYLTTILIQTSYSVD